MEAPNDRPANRAMTYVRGGRRVSDPDLDVILSVNLMRLREAAGLSQTAAAVAFGASYQTIWKWESGRGRPLLSMAPVICRVYGCTLDELFRGCPR